jgi:hypothetical protein
VKAWKGVKEPNLNFWRWKLQYLRWKIFLWQKLTNLTEGKNSEPGDKANETIQNITQTEKKKKPSISDGDKANETIQNITQTEKKKKKKKKKTQHKWPLEVQAASHIRNWSLQSKEKGVCVTIS